MPQPGGLCKLYPPTPPLQRPGHPVCWGSQPCVPAAWLAERLLLAGDIEKDVSRESGASADQVEETPGRASLEKLGCRTPPQLHVGGVGRQRQLTTYYRSNSLRAYPDKTQVTSFHLKTREAKRTLEVKWNNTDLENTPHPKYLGITLDRTLSYKKHIHNT